MGFHGVQSGLDAGFVARRGSVLGAILALGLSLSPQSGAADDLAEPAAAADREFVVFSARSNEPGVFRRIWRTNGTARGTVELSRDFALPENIVSLGDGRALFSAIRNNRYSPVITNGRPRNTRVILDADAGMGNPSRGFAWLNENQIVFQGYSQADGFELWITNLRERGTRLVRDINPAVSFGLARSSTPFDITPLGDGRAVFQADDGVHGIELWVTNGREGGTRLVVDGVAGAGNNTIRDITPIGNGRAIYNGLNARFRAVMFVTDGTPGGTFELQPASGAVFNPRGFMLMGDGSVLFAAGNDSSVRGMWVTDGTPAGTRPLLIDGAPIAMSNLTAMGDGTALFSQTHNDQLWIGRTDGTPEGTRRIAPITPGRNVNAPWGGLVREIAPTGDGGAMVIVRYDNTPGLQPTYELWLTDAETRGGTNRVRVFDNSVDANPAMLTPAGNGRMVFVATSPAEGRELWVTNGRRAGTRVLVDIFPGATGSEPAGLVNLLRP